MKSTAHRYGPVAIAIHWLSAILVIVLLASGFRSGFAEDAATKTAALRIHLPVAIALLALTLGRLIWWWRFDRKPAPLPEIPHWQDQVARWTHRALHVLILMMLGSGIAMSVLSGLPDALFGTAPLPVLDDLAPRAGHGIGARLIAAAILLHAGAALYHHFVLKDATLRRIWPVKR